MHRKLRYVSKRNKLVQMVAQVQYNVNVIYSLGADTDRHTDVADKSNIKNQARAGLWPALSWFKKFRCYNLTSIIMGFSDI